MYGGCPYTGKPFQAIFLQVYVLHTNV